MPASELALLAPLDVERLTAEEVLKIVLAACPGRVALASSFQKEETVLLDMLFALEPKARVFALDTHHLFPETYAYWREVERRYATRVEVFAGPAPEELALSHGPALWQTQPDLYLELAKLEPLARALRELDCWVTGVRRDQAKTRAKAAKLAWDEDHGLFKANPLADWTDEDCWAYIEERRLPYNPLHDLGFGSIGDTHSTVPGQGRAGRWAGQERVECGLHPA